MFIESNNEEENTNEDTNGGNVAEESSDVSPLPVDTVLQGMWLHTVLYVMLGSVDNDTTEEMMPGSEMDHSTTHSQNKGL